MIYQPNILKCCIKCGSQKLPTEFYTNKSSKDGLINTCKQCTIKRTNAYRAAHPEKRQVESQRRKESGKQKLASARYYQKHSERVYAWNNNYRSRHPGIANKWSKAWRDANPERVMELRLKNRNKALAQQKAYRSAFPEKKRAQVRKRRAKKRNLPTANINWQYALEYFHGVCAYCEQGPRATDKSQTLHQDHYIPMNADGCPGDIPTNVVPACQTCNLSKGWKLPSIWLVRHFGTDKAKEIEVRIQAYFEQVKQENTH